MGMIYLIRHTTPAVARGMCYGQSDLDVTGSFHEEAAVIRQYLPGTIGLVYSSPLKRCTLLAKELFPGAPLRLSPELKEIHCGDWEMRTWDDLPQEEVNPWMADFVRVRIPGGESYMDLHERVTRCWETINGEDATSWKTICGEDAHSREPARGDIAVIAHGGVIRSILSGITGTALIDSFKAFSLHYGCVIRVSEASGGGKDGARGRWEYEVLFNPAPAEKEQHKPKAFYQ
jgi:alpha-ribazole phosphatase